MPKVTAQIITLNEEEMLPLCLAGVAWADEILVVDSGSTDRTVEIARAAGARVLEHPFEGYASQNNWGFEQAANEWILMVDADEVVDPELGAAVRKVLEAGPEFEVYDVVRDAYFMGRRMKSSSWSGERLPRFFRKGCLTFTGLVHPVPEFGGRKVGLLEGRLLHHSVRDMEQYFRKFQQYTTLWARKEFESGKRVGLPYCVATSVWRFFHNYLMRGEIRDGAQGFLSSVLAMAYTFIKYVKLWGLWQARESGKGAEKCASRS